MPLAACPTCATALRVPDGPAPAVRCPKCRTVFQPAAPPPPAPPPARPAFGSAAQPVPPPPLPSRPSFGSGATLVPLPRPPPPAPFKPPPLVPLSAVRPRPAPEPDFEVIDAAPAPEPEEALPLDDEDNDRRPRKAVLLGNDRPRRAELADEDDDRPRRKRRVKDDDDDDEYDEYDTARRNPFKPAAVGALLLAISFWIYLGVFGLLALVALVAWAGGNPPEALAILAGIAGLGNWVLAGVGVGFLLAGPPRTRGLTIAAAVLAGVHFLIMALVAADIADAQRLLGVLGAASPGQVLYAFITLLPFVDTLLPVLCYSNKLGPGRVPGEYFVLVLGGACEIARLILLVLALGAHGRAARDYAVGETAKTGVMAVAWTCGGAAVLVLVVVLMIVEGKMGRSARHLLGATGLLVFVGYALMLILPAVTAHAARAALSRKARKAGRGR